MGPRICGPMPSRWRSQLQRASVERFGRARRGAEMVDDGSGCVEGLTVVIERATVPGFPGADRLLEVAEVVISKENERLHGLDQHAAATCEAMPVRALGEYPSVSAPAMKRARSGPSGLAGASRRIGVELAIEQVVVAGSEVAVQHQELRNGCSRAVVPRWRCWSGSLAHACGSGTGRGSCGRRRRRSCSRPHGRPAVEIAGVEVDGLDRHGSRLRRHQLDSKDL